MRKLRRGDMLAVARGAFKDAEALEHIVQENRKPQTPGQRRANNLAHMRGKITRDNTGDQSLAKAARRVKKLLKGG